MPDRSVTDRGFTTYDQLRDHNGTLVVVRQSSLATEDCVWIFSEDHETGDRRPPHLNVEQATRVRDALDAFISEHASA